MNPINGYARLEWVLSMCRDEDVAEAIRAAMQVAWLKLSCADRQRLNRRASCDQANGIPPSAGERRDREPTKP